MLSTSRPPGASTRWISEIARSGVATCSSTSIRKTASKLASAKQRRSQTSATTSGPRAGSRSTFTTRLSRSLAIRSRQRPSRSDVQHALRTRARFERFDLALEQLVQVLAAEAIGSVDHERLDRRSVARGERSAGAVGPSDPIPPTGPDASAGEGLRWRASSCAASVRSARRASPASCAACPSRRRRSGNSSSATTPGGSPAPTSRARSTRSGAARKCGFLWQAYHLDADGMQRLYEEWISADESLAKKTRADVEPLRRLRARGLRDRAPSRTQALRASRARFRHGLGRLVPDGAGLRLPRRGLRAVAAPLRVRARAGHPRDRLAEAALERYDYINCHQRSSTSPTRSRRSRAW